MAKIGFDNGKGYFFCFSSVFAFKQTKEQIMLQAKPLKMLKK